MPVRTTAPAAPPRAIRRVRALPTTLLGLAALAAVAITPTAANAVDGGADPPARSAAAFSAVASPSVASAWVASRSVASLPVASASVASGVPAGSARRAAAGWSWPVPPPIVVVAPFRAPPTPYAAGHRGIDLAADPGAAIRAPAAGTVSFAGPVAGRGVVAIDHGGGVVSAIEPLAATVADGAAVSAGDVIGTVSSGGHCSAACVHFGVRVDGEYVSPFLFLGGLPRAVLLPMT